VTPVERETLTRRLWARLLDGNRNVRYAPSEPAAFFREVVDEVERWDLARAHTSVDDVGRGGENGSAREEDVA